MSQTIDDNVQPSRRLTMVAAINQALDDMDADGTREAILKKYGVWDASLTKEAIMNK